MFFSFEMDEQSKHNKCDLKNIERNIGVMELICGERDKKGREWKRDSGCGLVPFLF